MNYRRVGKSGLKISEISLGAWLTYGGSVDPDCSIKIIRAAIEHGINFIDIADIYGMGEGEQVVGKAVKNLDRSSLVLSSKLFFPMSEEINDRGLSRKHIIESCEKSLKRVGTDYLDIYFCHRFDPESETEETVRAMEDLIRQGKILYWGTSVWSAAQITEAVYQAEKWNAFQPIVEQPRYNMLDRHIEIDTIKTCKQHGIGFTVWSPLAQGLLTGKYNDGVPDESRGGSTRWLRHDLTEDNLTKVRQLTELAGELEISIGQLALAWILRKPEISCAIVGATSVDQLVENIRATDVQLDKGTQEKIETILNNRPAPLI